MGRIIVAVLAGYAAIGVLVVLTDQVFAMAVPGFRSMGSPPLYYFVISLVTNAIYSAVGGYLCCRIARDGCQRATVALIVFGEAIGLASQIALWNIVPHAFGIALLVIYPVAVWLGSRVCVRNSATRRMEMPRHG